MVSKGEAGRVVVPKLKHNKLSRTLGSFSYWTGWLARGACLVPFLPLLHAGLPYFRRRALAQAKNKVNRLNCPTSKVPFCFFVTNDIDRGLENFVMNFRSPLSLLAIALVAFSATTAQAQVDTQLNLRYDDPNDEAAGGTWDLLVQSAGPNGLAGLRVVIDGITGVTGVDTPGSAITANADAFDNTSSVFRFQPFGGGSAIEIIAGDDLAGALIVGVGSGSGASNIASDDLFPGNSPVWDNSSLLASGTFGAIRPAFLEVDPANGNLSPGSTVYALANEFAAVASDPVLAATIGDVSVRGDGVASDGLLAGDANRDGSVDGNDFSILALNFNSAGGWDEGDFNSSAAIDGNDFSALALNFNGSSAPPALSGVATPEPTSAALAALALISFVGVRRKR